MVEITLPVVMCWAMAIWWFVLGVRDFNNMEYGRRTGRYHKPGPFLLATLASMDAGLMGYFVAYHQRAITMALVIVMVVLFALWIMAAMHYRHYP